MYTSNCFLFSWFQGAGALSPVDPSVLLDLERYSQMLGTELDEMMEGLKSSLHAVRHKYTCRSTISHTTVLYMQDCIVGHYQRTTFQWL